MKQKLLCIVAIIIAALAYLAVTTTSKRSITCKDCVSIETVYDLNNTAEYWLTINNSDLKIDKALADKIVTSKGSDELLLITRHWYSSRWEYARTLNKDTIIHLQNHGDSETLEVPPADSIGN